MGAFLIVSHGFSSFLIGLSTQAADVRTAGLMKTDDGTAHMITCSPPPSTPPVLPGPPRPLHRPRRPGLPPPPGFCSCACARLCRDGSCECARLCRDGPGRSGRERLDAPDTRRHEGCRAPSPRPDASGLRCQETVMPFFCAACVQQRVADDSSTVSDGLGRAAGAPVVRGCDGGCVRGSECGGRLLAPSGAAAGRRAGPTVRPLLCCRQARHGAAARPAPPVTALRPSTLRAVHP